MELSADGDLQHIPNPWVYDFRKDLYENYSRLCLSNRQFHSDDIPSDSQIVDELMIWCHEAASLYQFSDPHYYRVLESDEERDQFYDETLLNHLSPFIFDVYRIAESAHLSLFISHKNEYINFPVKGVW